MINPVGSDHSPPQNPNNMERLLKALPYFLQMQKAIANEKMLSSNLFALLDVVEANEKDPNKKFGYKAAINEAIEKIVKGE